MDEVVVLRLAGVLAMVGALLYIVGDSLLLAVKPAPEPHPRLAEHASLVGGMARLAELDPGRIVPGGLLGVFATPFVMLGWWQLAQGLAPAGELAAVGPPALFALGSVIGAFVHGWFMALAEDVRLLARASDATAPHLVEVVGRARRILAVAYAPVVLAVLVASAWFSLAVIGGSTAFPAWLAAANPIVLLAAFLVVRRVLPARLADPLEGTGFNVAYLAFFALTTATLWSAAG